VPIYEYRCSKCGEFEVMQRMSDEPLRTCPTCRRKVTKLISNTSFQLKGSGWYITDYARKGQAEPATKGDASSDSSTDSKSDTTTADTAKSDTKSDTKSTTTEGGSSGKGSGKKSKTKGTKAAA